MSLPRACFSQPPFAFLFPLCALLFCMPAHAQQWKSFRFANEGFTISLPADPAFSKRDVPTQAGSFELRSYLIESANAALFIGICDYGAAAANADPQAQLQGAKNGALENSHSHLLREKPITLGIYPGIEFESESNPDPGKSANQQEIPTHFYVRVYMVGTTLYQTLVVYPGNSEYPNILRFLDSFQLIPRSKE